MAVNKETQKSVSTILDKNIVIKLEEIAGKSKRSVSAQISYIVEKFILEEENKHLKK